MTFETGKTYHAKNGRFLRIERKDPDRLVGKDDTYTIIYDDAGRPVGSGWSEFVLLPGAIEDEKPNNPNDGTEFDRRFGILDKRVAAAIDSLTDLLANHQKQIDELRERWSPAPPPRTIKGGWVNVYKVSNGYLSLDHCVGPYSRRDLADTGAERLSDRLACIHIPDIEEGEGL